MSVTQNLPSTDGSYVGQSISSTLELENILLKLKSPSPAHNCNCSAFLAISGELLSTLVVTESPLAMLRNAPKHKNSNYKVTRAQ